MSAPQIVETSKSTIVALPADEEFLRPTLLRVMDLVRDVLDKFHKKEIHFNVRQKRDIRWTPSYCVGKPTSNYSRPYTKMSLAEYLNDIEDAGNNSKKAGEYTSVALDLLASIEKGMVSREKVEELAHAGVSLRAFKEMRKLLK